MTSLLLGLDVSPKRMGWGLVDLVTGAPVACGMENIDLPSAGWAHTQIARALYTVAPYERDWEVQAVYIEQPWLSPRSGTKSAYSAGRAVQAAQAEVERRWPWAPIEYLQPSEWKLLAGLKGNASKAEVMAAFIDLWGHRAVGLSSQDAADALLIAVAGFHRNEDTNARAAEWAAKAVP